MLFKGHVGFIKRKSPEGIKMKKGSLLKWFFLALPLT